ncbi:MAG: hypothetical protein FWE18_02615 [Alphaproteobacteria bacterium]|nr:hypothetical protein [Alphaproteobacteria bacterium]
MIKYSFVFIFLAFFSFRGLSYAEELDVFNAEPERDAGAEVINSVSQAVQEPINYKGHYIRFGNAISSSDGAKGNISNFDFSVFSYKQFILGVSLEQGLYSYNGGYYGKIKQVNDFAKKADFNNLYEDIDRIKGMTTTTNGFLTLMYDFGKPRGFYAIGGVGYGLRAKVKGNLKDMAYLASAVNSGKTVQELQNDPRFQDAMNSLSKNPSDLINLINQILPGNTDLTSQVDSYDKIQDLLTNESALTQFLNDAQGRFDSTSLNQLNSLSAVCNTLIACDYGMSYTVGVGYDLPIWRALGIDFQAKSRFMAHTSPIYSGGANLIFRW